MTINVWVGLPLFAISCLLLLIGLIVRENDKRPVLFWGVAMTLPMMVGIFMFTGYFGWQRAIRGGVGVVVGLMLWAVIYQVAGTRWAYETWLKVVLFVAKLPLA